MNSSHVMATGGLTVILTNVLVYLSHWPLQPLSVDEASSFAGLIIFVVGAVVARSNSNARRAAKEVELSTLSAAQPLAPSAPQAG